MNRRLMIILAVALVVVIGIIAAITYHKSPSNSGASRQTNSQSHSSSSQSSSTTKTSNTTSSSQQAANIPNDDAVSGVLEVQTSDPTLQAGNFSIVNKQEPASGWYIITVSPGGGQGDNEIVVMKQVNNSLSVVIGPGTAFSSSSLASTGVPQAVQNQLNVYND